MRGFQEVATQVFPGCRLLSATRLVGGVSAEVTALELETENGPRKIVVRRYGEGDLSVRPRVAFEEFSLLTLLQGPGLPVPAPLLCDETGQLLPSPFIVTSFVEADGLTPPLADMMAVMAAFLARLHHLKLSAETMSFLPSRPLPLGVRRCEPVLLHGDFWTGNILWRQGELAAVLDWEDAVLGDPQADVAGARLELLWALGVDAMELFTAAYRQASGDPLRDLPVFDAAEADRVGSWVAGWGLAPEQERRMGEQLRWFRDQALHKQKGPLGESGPL